MSESNQIEKIEFIVSILKREFSHLKIGMIYIANHKVIEIYDGKIFLAVVTITSNNKIEITYNDIIKNEPMSIILHNLLEEKLGTKPIVKTAKL